MKQKKISFSVILSFIIFLTALIIKGNTKQYFQNSSFNPHPGLIPNKKVAENFATLILESLYGDKLKHEEPFSAKLENDSTWVVTGTRKEPTIGGVVIMKFNRSDCRVISIVHEK